jgi:membrane protease YdiL (CAAX protease family)
MAPISRKAEFPLIFFLIFLPAYLNQGPLPRGVFDYPLYQGQIILQSLLIFLLVRYLMERTPPADGKAYESAFAPALVPLHALITLGGLALIYAVYTLGLVPLLPEGLSPPDELVLITRYHMLPLALISCLTAAGMEEFFFRGYAWIRLKETGLNGIPALLTVSLLFAAGHLYEGIGAALFAWGSGLFLGILVIRGFSLYSLTLSHGLFNFAMILISYLRQGPSS